MIPYDDLVAQLQSWRARQGLPVAVSATSGSAPVVAAMPGSGPTPGSGPRTAPPAPPRTNPPAAPPSRMPMPLAAPEESLDDHMEVDEAAMIDEQHYENEGDDFALAFNAATAGQHEEGDSTMIGGAPERPSEPTDPTGGRGGPPDREDW
jgi:hypothetical protein